MVQKGGSVPYSVTEEYMGKTKLNYIFHDPNARDVTASFLIDLFVEVNAAKVDRIISEAVRGREADAAVPVLPSEPFTAEVGRGL